jgi:hypothetical protein
MYVAFVASGYFKTRSSVVSPSLPFCYLVSLSGAGRQRRFPLARVGHLCLQAGATDEMWAGRRGTRDRGAGVWIVG